MAAEETTGGDSVPGADTADSAASDTYQYLKWWAYLSYIVGALGILGALASVLTGLATLGSAGAAATAAGAVPSLFQMGAAGVALIIMGVISGAFGVLYVIIGRGVRRRSSRWWTIGMIIYGLGLLFSLVTFNLIGIVLLAVGLFLGYQGREAVEGSTPI